MPHRPLSIILAGSLAAIGTVAWLTWVLLPPSPPGPSIGFPFTLTDTAGKKITARDFRGKYMLIYFGYTNCPDICPTTLSTIAKALTLLGHQADLIQPIFITVDPARDTPAIMARYVALFSSRLIGLSASPAQTQTLEREYGIYVGPEDPKTGIIKHSAMLYLMDPNGRYIGSLYDDATSAALAAELTKAMSPHNS